MPVFQEPNAAARILQGFLDSIRTGLYRPFHETHENVSSSLILILPKTSSVGEHCRALVSKCISATTKNSFQSHTLTTWICMLNLAMSTTCCSRPCGSLAWQWSIEAGELLARCSSLSTVLGVWGPQCIRKSAPGNSIEALLSICQFDWASWVDVQNWQENYWNILKWRFLHLVIYVYVFVHSVSLWYMSVGSALVSISQCDQHGGQNVVESYHGGIVAMERSLNFNLQTDC